MPPILLLLIILIVVFSLFAFNNAELFDRYLFSVSAIRNNKQYDRLLTSIFLHAGIFHLLFNLYTFYIFGSSMEKAFGSFFLIILFVSSGVGGNIITLYLKRQEPSYSAVGASGAVSGIIFSAIFLFPGIQIGIFPIPFMIDAWLFGILYILISIVAAAREAGNIGHEAHLGGALIGMLVTIAFFPQILFQQTLLVAVLVLPIVALLILSYRDANFLQKIIGRFFH